MPNLLTILQLILVLTCLSCGSVDSSRFGCVDAQAVQDGALCRHALPVTVAPGADLELVLEAVVRWNGLSQELVGHDVLIWEGQADPAIVTRLDQEQVSAMADVKPAQGFVAGFHNHGHVYYSLPHPSVIAHELGHYLGLQHVLHGQMQLVDPPGEFSDDDEEEFIRVWR